MNKEIEAFILTGHQFESNNKQILKLYGRSDSGPLVITIDNFKNYFYSETNKISKLKALDGRPVEKTFYSHSQELKNQLNSLENARLKSYESDIRLLDRFLMDLEIYAQVKIKGVASNENNLLHFHNPEITSSTFFPKVSIYSFDIETSKKGEVISLAYEYRFKDQSQKHVYVLNNQGKLEENQGDITFVKTEKEILMAFEKSIRELDPDIITGWNVVGFDLKFMVQKAKSLNYALKIGRTNKDLDVFQNLRGEWRINIDGRVVVDGPRALKSNFFSFESYKLNFVAKSLLGESKDIDEDEVEDKWGEIERRFREDKISLAIYNLKDASLVLDIYEKINLIDLLLNRSLISGMLIERVGGSVAAFDHFYLPSLHKEGIVALNVSDVTWSKYGKGGFVIDPIVGIHQNVLVMDFKSLYPTIIKTFFIDPLANFLSSIGPVKTPMGLNFSRTKNILPQKISQLLDIRAMAKEQKNANLSQSVKILMNSFYGVMGSDGCRFYHEHLSDGVTGTGQWILKTVKTYLEEHGFAVLYGDTDSIFVQIPKNSDYKEIQKTLPQQVNSFLQNKLMNEFKVESQLEIQFDKFFKTLILTPVRGEGEGAKKRYAGLSLVEEKGKIEEKIVITGMEYVRSDWSELAKNFQYELLRRIFHGEDLTDFIVNTVKKLENGELDHQLVLSKRLSKPLEDYVKSVPPHAKAAKILFEARGIIRNRPRYVMTKRGPMPVELEPRDYDYEYYINKQIAPLGNSILSLLGKNFEDYIKGQMSLF